MILYLDTTDFNNLRFAVADAQGKQRSQTFRLDSHQSTKTVALLEKFLKTNKIAGSNVKQIVINKGPGSYTGVRVGMAMAMALFLAWGAKVRPVAASKFRIQ